MTKNFQPTFKDHNDWDGNHEKQTSCHLRVALLRIYFAGQKNALHYDRGGIPETQHYPLHLGQGFVPLRLRIYFHVLTCEFIYT